MATEPDADGRRRLPRGRLAVAVLLPVLLVLVWAAVAAVQARDHLLAARDTLNAELAGNSPSQEDRLDALQSSLATAGDRARAARRLLRHPAPALLARVPVLGRSLAAERDVAEAAAAALTAGERLAPLVRDVQVQGGGVDMRVLDRLAVALSEAAEQVRGPSRDLGRAPVGLTPRAVQDAVAEARGPLADLPSALERAAAGVRAGAGLLGAEGPRSIVLAVMNNAELRGAGGYASSFTVLSTDQGRIAVAPFQDTNEVFDPAQSAVRVPAPADYRERWGPLLADTTLGKNALMSAHVPSSASVLCEAVRQRVPAGCDAVVLLDVPALAELITLTGPVRLPDGSAVGGQDLVRELLVDVYAEIGAGDDSGEVRRRALRAAADEALTAVLAGGLTGVDALQVLVRAAQGRHLSVWSAQAQEQQGLVMAGLAGSADPGPDDLALAAVNQLGASKLDYYVDREVAVSAVVGRDSARVTSTVALSLDLPDALPAYVVGASGGRLVGLLDIGVGAGATVLLVEQDGQPVETTLQQEAGGGRVPFAIDLADGSRSTWTITYEVPVEDGRYRLQLVPQPLASDAELTLSIDPEPGLELRDGPVRRSGPFTSSQTVEVRADAPSWWSRPVELG